MKKIINMSKNTYSLDGIATVVAYLIVNNIKPKDVKLQCIEDEGESINVLWTVVIQ